MASIASVAEIRNQKSEIRSCLENKENGLWSLWKTASVFQAAVGKVGGSAPGLSTSAAASIALPGPVLPRGSHRAPRWSPGTLRDAPRLPHALSVRSDESRGPDPVDDPKTR